MDIKVVEWREEEISPWLFLGSDYLRYISYYTYYYMRMILIYLLPSLKYILFTYLFNKRFIKVYLYLISSLIFNYLTILFIDIITNKVSVTLHCISWLFSELLLGNISFIINSLIQLFIILITIISSYIQIYSLD